MATGSQSVSHVPGLRRLLGLIQSRSTLEVISDQAAFSFDITIVQDGQKLTATGESGEFGQIELEGTLNDGNVRFAWDSDFQGTPVYIVFSGTVADDSMSGSADFGGMVQGDWSAKRAEG